MNIFCFLLLLSTFSLCSSLQTVKKQVESNKVDRWIGDGNYTKILRSILSQDESSNLIAILFTNKNCQTCQGNEHQLKKIQQSFVQSGIPVFRCSISENMKLSEKLKIKRFPIIHFVMKKLKSDKRQSQIKIYKTNQILTQDITQLAKYLKKTLKHQQSKITNNEVKNSQNFELIETLEDIPTTNRIIVNFDQLRKIYGLRESEFISEVVLNEKFNTLPVIPLSKELFSFYTIQYDIQPSISPKSQLNPLVVISIQSQHQNGWIHIPFSHQHMIKLTTANLEIHFIFQTFLLYSVQQFTQEMYSIQRQLSSALNTPNPIYLAVLDSIWKRNESVTHLKMLNNVLHQFQRQIDIFWTEGQINPEKKILLGFQKQQQPPMFGRLILARNQLKQPLKDPINNKPVFNQHSIIQQIQRDLGYQNKLSDKIIKSLQDLNLGNQIKITQHINYETNSPQIKLVYCTSHNLDHDEINQLYFLISRFKRFYPHSSLKILTEPCFIDKKQILDGLSMVFRSSTLSISTEVQSCTNLQSKLKQLTDRFAHKISRKSLLPQNFCIQGHQMRDYLFAIQSN